jgi:hypothetical protein
VKELENVAPYISALRQILKRIEMRIATLEELLSQLLGQCVKEAV